MQASPNAGHLRIFGNHIFSLTLEGDLDLDLDLDLNTIRPGPG